MLCSECNKDVNKGKVDKGKFICIHCNKKLKLLSGEGSLITRYRLVYEKGQPFIAKAVLKNNPKSYKLVEGGQWWGNVGESITKGWREYPPGYESPQRACQNRFEEVLRDINRIKASLKSSQDKLNQLTEFCVKENIALMEPKTDDIVF